MSSASTPDTLVTSRFQLDVARVLQPVAPALAALHVRRSRSLRLGTRDNLASSHCASCGVFLLDGTGSKRIIRHARTKRRPKAEGECSRPVRAVQISCSMCGHEEETPVAPKDALSPPEKAAPPKRPAETAQNWRTVNQKVSTSEEVQSWRTGNQKNVSTGSPTTAPPLAPSKEVPPTKTSAVSAPPSTQKLGGMPQGNAAARQKNRPKKSSGLQDMLARNRQREEQEKKQAGGLSALLEKL
ncbi:hypothetical protein EIP91_006682 [Steccherinum ochraceum]|uniref:Uncharacterized protein n=1 Tax=Steccherinum ochraceum TaxID=92696 RepID=A0A4R0RTD7_9APHY|nr:hypothetical protein EIP91_006682 [Steccherinum ochraceum]